MSKNQMLTDGFSITRNADVDVQKVDMPVPGSRDKTSTHCRIVVNGGEHTHDFKSESRFSRALLSNTPKQIANRLSGGTYFWKGDELVTCQPGDYNGFIHTDNALCGLIEHVGYEEGPTSTRHHNNRLQTRDVRLQATHSDVEIEVPVAGDGGHVNSRLAFRWNPFEAHVSTAYELVRLLCQNGMTGTSSLLSARVPLINDRIMEQDLAVANRQVQNKVTAMIGRRMEEMVSQTATVDQCQKIMGHAMARIKSPLNNGEGHYAERAHKMLHDIALVANPRAQTAEYNERMLADKRATSQHPSHLSLFTLWNMFTEMASHTQQVEGSSSFALDKMANTLLFEGGYTKSSGRGKIEVPTVFNDPSAAFIGDLR